MSIDCALVRPLADRSLSSDWVSERMTKIAQKILFRLSCEIDEAQKRERLESASLESLFVVANLMAGASCWRATANATLATCGDVITFFPSSISTPATFTSLRTCQVGSFGCLFLELCQDGRGWWGGCCVNCELAALCELNIQMKPAVTGAQVWM